jgi:hypothetical protein
MNVLDRMEQRLGTLERVVIEHEERPLIGRNQEQLLQAGDGARATDNRRTK